MNLPFVTANNFQISSYSKFPHTYQFNPMDNNNQIFDQPQNDETEIIESFYLEQTSPQPCSLINNSKKIQKLERKTKCSSKAMSPYTDGQSSTEHTIQELYNKVSPSSSDKNKTNYSYPDKNLPCLARNAVFAQVFDYFSDPENCKSHLNYIKNYFSTLSEEQYLLFLKFIVSYNEQKTQWQDDRSIISMITSLKQYEGGDIFFSLITKFFGVDGEQAFDYWLANSKSSPKLKQYLQNNKFAKKTIVNKMAKKFRSE